MRLFKIFQSKTKIFPAVAKIIFYYSFFIFLILFLLDYLAPGFVTNYFNPVYLLILAVISGIIIIQTD
ncbi:MAG: hypothetical protein A2729_04700 [Candidatus Buchananbacteria bacterium RIFCSPHIGHO2_01_FULL_39_14]|uniref:Uncharacterized protein n=1 Tax=Candidatus Buchananbacteria bacterium RIFCSPHIGHO2_01_FULL_39_14 TaxID=1797532 RepID=A0A1G1XV15_9BACT|nr:MAG: hypothetical protein A2729_04700 [Candidatus Buchananbacteria bacterium RIFCSPHIGHO2_01_FULL_39_14]OGY49238.1 MAG: hypothetical protein A3D39_03005 [Candidatus Buchananbacteria bacterium RIFCSPHIGHO2_02_FULL_39_17]